LAKFGFNVSKGGVHTSRTIMFDELELLFDAVEASGAVRETYLKAIIDDNCLKKRSVKTRRLTAGHLTSLYALDPSIPLFRGFRFFWQRDPVSHPLVTLLCAYARDPILKAAPRLSSISPRAKPSPVNPLNPARYGPSAPAARTNMPDYTALKSTKATVPA
jgi:hypothetical protein